jgi:hypothetical protein
MRRGDDLRVRGALIIKLLKRQALYRACLFLLCARQGAWCGSAIRLAVVVS